MPYPAVNALDNYYYKNYVLESQDKFCNESVTYAVDVKTWLYPSLHNVENNNSWMPFGFGRAIWRYPWSPQAIGPMEGSVSLTIWQRSNVREFDTDEWDRTGFRPDDQNPNTLVNGREIGDEFITERTNESKDPVYELFMLPYTEQKCFLLIVYTDYNIQPGDYRTVTGGCTSTLNDEYTRRRWNGEAYVDVYTEQGNRIEYRRSAPVHYFLKAITGPPLTGAATRIKAAAVALGRLLLKLAPKVIQQIILYEVEDGNLTKVEEEFIRRIARCGG